MSGSLLEPTTGLTSLMLAGDSCPWNPTLNDPTTDPGVSSSHYSTDSSYLPASWNAAGP